MTDLPLIPPPPSKTPEPGVVVLGRFQPFHSGHAYMLSSAASWRDENSPHSPIIITIGSSNRPQSMQNPWSADERADMIRSWVENIELENYEVVLVPDIDDPPNWVSHAVQYHGGRGVLYSSDLETCELYRNAGWDVVTLSLENRERFEGWRVRATMQMMSTVTDEEAVRMVLGQSIPEVVLSHLIESDGIRRLAFLGEGGEPVG